MMWIVALALVVFWIIYYIISYFYFYELNPISIIYHMIFLSNLFLATIAFYEIDKKLEIDSEDLKRENKLNETLAEESSHEDETNKN